MRHFTSYGPVAQFLLIFGIVGTLGGFVRSTAAQEKPGQSIGKSQSSAQVADADLAAWVDKRVDERQPPATDKRFDEIGWAKDIRHAMQLAKEHRRPVFLFTHDGKMNLGRC